MRDQYPYPRSAGEQSIVVAVILSILTCGLYTIYWQYKQIETLNYWLGREEYSFLLWLVLSIVTCGLFALYYEYTMSRGIVEIQERHGFPPSPDLPLTSVVLALFSFTVAAMAIEQYEINKFYEQPQSDI